QPDTEVFYKVSDYYSPEHEGGLIWDDPCVCVDWGIAAEDVVIVERDRSFPRLADLPAFF
ncbi:MAG TPA: dTDP-4-dehydrorhamnose 3,5-epimerase family protein, partial [Opitutus sp.]|nr:dTDP-4-dehydrorhamnose 3,5-epimerase family protein [Opitutus sp.]